jgi:DNA-binding NarL/FixJ family response regulator
MTSDIHARDPEWTAELTPRERDVMTLMVEGRPNKIIADELGISIRTVEVHRARVMSKLKVRNVVELVIAMHSHGMETPGMPGARFALAEPLVEPIADTRRPAPGAAAS